MVIVSEKGTFIMPDVSADVPLPLENAYVHGIALGDILEWEGIAYFEGEEAGGGGGSNGNGFYKLNLSGSPVPQSPGNYMLKGDLTAVASPPNLASRSVLLTKIGCQRIVSSLSVKRS
jgi:hypothetical protein